MKKEQKYILWFKEITSNYVPWVGGKNASLGEMYSKLSKKGINIPDGFALTSKAYWYYLEENGIDKKIKRIFKKFNPQSIKNLQKIGRQTRNLILKAKLPKNLEREILKNYKKLSKKYGEDFTDVAVRSSATA